MRSHAGVNPDNPFVFAATKGSMNAIHGNDVLCTHAFICGAQNPVDLTSTKLRKHIATMSQVMNLQPHELDQLASFMGHDVRIHKEFYRLSDDIFQTAKVVEIGKNTNCHGEGSSFKYTRKVTRSD